MIGSNVISMNSIIELICSGFKIENNGSKKFINSPPNNKVVILKPSEFTKKYQVLFALNLKLDKIKLPGTKKRKNKV